MSAHPLPSDTKASAFLDIGTNSVRLLVVGVTANRSYKVLHKEKVMIRLGDRGLVDQIITPEAMDRAILVCGKMVEVAQRFGADDIVAVATSATREAVNQSEFLQRLEDDANLEVRVVSGLEEARLIYLGVSRSIHLDNESALFVDIGGGSTELIVGDAHTHQYMSSLQLGAIRLTELFFNEDDTGPVSHERYLLLRQHVYNRSIRAIQKIQGMGFERAVGSSGTIENLADIAVRRFENRRRGRTDVLKRDQLAAVVEDLCGLSLQERREVAGINSKRADIIVGGAAILHTLMDALQIEEISISDRGVQDGLLVDYLATTEHELLARPLSVRERSVLNLARACHFDEPHARHVAALSIQLFDSARDAGLHTLGEWERELLTYAAILHDVGMFLSYSSHEAHTYYIIRHADLLGFDDNEIAILATTGLFHRKRVPRKKHQEFSEMEKRPRAIVKVLSMILSMAESLDRSHTGVVTEAHLTSSGGKAHLQLTADKDCQLEVWNVEQHREAFSKVFGCELEIGRVTVTGTDG